MENFANERTAQIYNGNEFTVPCVLVSKFTISYQYLYCNKFLNYSDGLVTI